MFVLAKTAENCGGVGFWYLCAITGPNNSMDIFRVLACLEVIEAGFNGVRLAIPDLEIVHDRIRLKSVPKSVEPQAGCNPFELDFFYHVSQCNSISSRAAFSKDLGSSMRVQQYCIVQQRSKCHINSTVSDVELFILLLYLHAPENDANQQTAITAPLVGLRWQGTTETGLAYIGLELGAAWIARWVSRYNIHKPMEN